MLTEPSESRIVKVLAYNLQVARQKRQLSQERLALKAGVHRTAYRLLEACLTETSLPTVERLAHALGTTVPALLTDPGGSLTLEDGPFRMSRGVHAKRKASKAASPRRVSV